METIDTISQLLQSSNSQYHFYDIGRKIERISTAQFEKIEQNQIPYPTPSQGHACIAIVFWQPKSTQPYLWLVKLPLDERGLLNQGARNHFIAIIIEALGADLSQDANEQQEELLKANPYLFTPAQYKLATLNSKIKLALKQASSEHLAPFRRYLTGQAGWHNWQTVGVQGITDFAVRLDEEDAVLLSKALPHLPTEVLLPLCSALENEPLPLVLLTALIALFKEKLLVKSNDVKDLVAIQQHLLRSLASTCQHAHVVELTRLLLQQQSVATDLLITLAGRCWLALASIDNLMTFFEQVIAHKDQALFNSIFKDLVAIPALRPIVFQCIRAPERSNALSAAIGNLFQQA